MGTDWIAALKVCTAQGTCDTGEGANKMAVCIVHNSLQTALPPPLAHNQHSACQPTHLHTTPTHHTTQVVELKEELKKRGLPVAGKKADLAERLTAAVEAEEVCCVVVESPSLSMVWSCCVAKLVLWCITDTYALPTCYVHIIALSTSTCVLCCAITCVVLCNAGGCTCRDHPASGRTASRRSS